MPGTKVIDSDGHVEPALVCDWKKYMRAPFGLMAEQMAAAAYDRNGDRTVTRRGGYDPEARMIDMDTEGIDVAVLFGGSVGLTTDYDEPGLSLAIAEGYNSWLHDFCSANPQRLKPAALIPIQNVDQACKEARRAVTELGHVGLVMKPFFENMTLDNSALDPIYAEAVSLDVPILVHGPGAVRKWLEKRYHTHFRRHAVDFPVSLMMGCMDVISGGVLERFPEMRIAFLEGSAGWFPWWIDRLDEHYEKLPHHVPAINEKPTDLVKRYIDGNRLFWSCEPDEKYLPFVVDQFGDDFILYASDYPHWDAIFPGSVKAISTNTKLSVESKPKILGANASILFGDRL